MRCRACNRPLTAEEQKLYDDFCRVCEVASMNETDDSEHDTSAGFYEDEPREGGGV